MKKKGLGSDWTTKNITKYHDVLSYSKSKLRKSDWEAKFRFIKIGTYLYQNIMMFELLFPVKVAIWLLYINNQILLFFCSM